MKSLILSALLLAFASPAQAGVDLKKTWADLSENYKGPFGLNYIQGERNRVAVKNGGNVKNRQFQAAYRNDEARALVRDHGFYLGNLFTTNYYELMGEYVFGNADSSHPLDNERMLAAGAKAMPKANQMVQYWVLEKYYLGMYPDSVYGKSFTYRGISDSANEQEYAKHFFNFYFSSIDGDFQYLPAVLLVNRSPIMDSASLDRARNLIAQAYDYYSQQWGWNYPQSSITELWDLRNAIHNQLNPSVVGELNEFLKKYPAYTRGDYRPVVEVRSILVAYFNSDASTLAKTAKTLGIEDVKVAAESLTKKVTVDGLLAISRAAAGWRANLIQVPYEKRAMTIALLAKVSKFVAKEISRLPAAGVKNAAVAEAMVNIVYVEGFLIRDNWEYFQKEAQASNGAASAILSDLVDAGTATLEESFSAALPKWKSLDPKMQSFIDNSMKSSALNTAAQVAERMKK